MNKFFKYIFIYFFIVSCGYQPIFSGKKVNFGIEKLTYNKNNEIDSAINNNLKNYKNLENKDKILDLEISSKINKVTTSLDDRGDPKSFRLVYYFPTFALVYLIFSIIESIRGNYILLYLIAAYMILIFLSSTIVNRSLKIGLLSIITSGIQILGYGLGYLKSSIILIFNNKNIEKVFPEVFFTK